MKKIRIVLVLLWALLWCVSLSLPVVMVGANSDLAWRGIIVLMLGWMGVLNGQLGWLANLTLPGVAFLSLIKGAPVTLRLCAAVFQIGLAINALSWDWIADEGGVHPIEAFGSGYYVWLGVMVGSAGVLFVVTVHDILNRKRKLSPHRKTGSLTG